MWHLGEAWTPHHAVLIPIESRHNLDFVALAASVQNSRPKQLTWDSDFDLDVDSNFGANVLEANFAADKSQFVEATVFKLLL